MENLMKDIVMSDVVQGLLEDLLFEIENGLINLPEYKVICNLIQAKIDEDTTLLLEPLEVAKIVERAVMTYSGRNVRAEFKKFRHFVKPEESVEIAFAKELGQTKELKLN